MSQQEPPSQENIARDRAQFFGPPWLVAGQLSPQDQPQQKSGPRNPPGTLPSFPSPRVQQGQFQPQQPISGITKNPFLPQQPGSGMQPSAVQQQPMPGEMQPPFQATSSGAWAASGPLQNQQGRMQNPFEPAQAGFMPQNPQMSSSFLAGPPSVSGQAATAWNTQGRPLQMQAPVAQPVFAARPEARKRRGRSGARKIVLLGVLLVLIVAGSILGPGLWQNLQDSNAGAPPGAANGFVSPPYSAKQINAIQHLASHMQARQLAKLYVARMSLDEKLGQLLMVQYTPDIYTDDLDMMITQQHVGGIIMYENQYTHQLRTVTQVKQDTAHMQRGATTPLFISTDQEGSVDRIGLVYPQTNFLSAREMRQAGDPTVASNEGDMVAKDLLNLGINVDFAPVVDISADTNYIGADARAFGENANDVIKYAGPYLKAMQAAGVVGTVKHFPGLGSVPLGDDPHGTLPIVNETRDQLEQTDLAPYKHFINATDPHEQPGFIMPTDMLVPAIDPTYPAEFSHIFMTDILRKELGYDGAVISDSVIMGGVKVNGVQLTQAQASLLAIQAGDDMVLDVSDSDNVADVISTFKDALQKGTLTQARIDEAVSRIITLKMQYHLIPMKVS